MDLYPACRAVWLVLENDALGEKLGANAVGLGKTPLSPRGRSRSNALLDPVHIWVGTAAQPIARVAFEETH